VRPVTLAPERPGARELVRLLVGCGAVVGASQSLVGHTMKVSIQSFTLEDGSLTSSLFSLDEAIHTLGYSG
jgi:N-acetylglucosamine-6-phosphate deacetylase